MKNKNKKREIATKGIPITCLLVGEVQERVYFAIAMGGRANRDYWCEFQPNQLARLIGKDPSNRCVRKHIKQARDRLTGRGLLEKHPKRAAWRTIIEEAPDGWIEYINLFYGGKKSRTRWVHPWAAMEERDKFYADQLPEIYLTSDDTLKHLTDQYPNLVDLTKTEALKFWAHEFPSKVENNENPGWNNCWNSKVEEAVKDVGLTMRNLKCQMMILVLANFIKKTGEGPNKGPGGIFQFLHFFGSKIGLPDERVNKFANYQLVGENGVIDWMKRQVKESTPTLRDMYDEQNEEPDELTDTQDNDSDEDAGESDDVNEPAVEEASTSSDAVAPPANGDKGPVASEPDDVNGEEEPVVSEPDDKDWEAPFEGETIEDETSLDEAEKSLNSSSLLEPEPKGTFCAYDLAMARRNE